MLTIDGMTRLLLAAALIIVIVIHLASLFNMPFSIIYVLLVFGSLLGFEYFKLEEIMHSGFRFVVPGVITVVIWHCFGRKLLLSKHH